MLTTTVAFLALLTTPAFATPIDFVSRRRVLPSSSSSSSTTTTTTDAVFTTTSVQVKLLPLNPKRTKPVTTTTTTSTATTTSVASSTSTWDPVTTTWAPVPTTTTMTTSTTTKTTTTTTKAPTTTTKPPSTTTKATTTTKTTTTTLAPTPTGFSLAWQAKGWSFFDSFDFFTWDDPTRGSVTFGDLGQSWDRGLLAVTESTASLRMDNTTVLRKGVNRNSVRISSKQQITMGSLVVLDVNKAAYGPSVWGAQWLVGGSWPNGGEIDIFEGVNDAQRNQMTLHTAPGCTLSTPMDASGTILSTICDATQNWNEGCGVADPSSSSYGAAFEKAGGGVWVTHMGVDAISIWFFLRDNIPADITAGAPKFSNWGVPRARWAKGTCDMQKYFKAQNLVINITACGDWAGSVSAWTAAGYTDTCADKIADPKNFDNAVFEFNSVKVYKPLQ